MKKRAEELKTVLTPDMEIESFEFVLPGFQEIACVHEFISYLSCGILLFFSPLLLFFIVLIFHIAKNSQSQVFYVQDGHLFYIRCFVMTLLSSLLFESWDT